MSTPAIWPTRLPAPRLDQYSYQAVSPFTRSDMDSGTARQRRRFVSTPTRITAGWRLSSAQLQVFEDFVSEVLDGGVLWFQLPLASARGLQPTLARLIEPPRIASAGAPQIWDVTATLETMTLRGNPHG